MRTQGRVFWVAFVCIFCFAVENAKADDETPASLDENSTLSQPELLAPMQPCDSRERLEILDSLETDEQIVQFLKKLPIAPSKVLDQGCVAFLRGQGAYLLEENEEALLQFVIAKKKLPYLKEGIDLWILRAQLEVDPKVALKTISTLNRKFRRYPSLKKELALLEAEAIVKKGKPEEILRVQGALLRKHIGEPAEALHHLAQAFKALDNERAANATLRSLLVEHPGHLRARAQEHRLGKDVVLSPKEQALRVENLIKISRMQRALDEAQAYSRVGLSRTKDRVPLEVATVKALVRADDPEGAVRYSTRLLARHKPDFQWLRIHAWALGKARHYDEARLAWKDVLKAAKTKSEKSDACFFQGFTAYETNQDVLAENLWSSCEADLKGSAFASSALWYRGLLHYTATKGPNADAARLPLALKIWQRLQKEHSAHKESSKHLYWLARAFYDANKTLEAQKIWARLLARHPTSYYGLLAARRLDLPAIEGTAISSTALADLLPKSRALLQIEQAHRLHLDGLAKDRITHLKKNEQAGAQQRIGLFHDVWRKGARGIPAPPVKDRKLVDVAGWRMSYATPFSELVFAAAEKYGIDASFTYAIMRTESGFLTTAKSPAGALGLLQLMPYTGIGMARKLHQAPPDVEELLSPEINIELGTAFLATSKKEFGSILLAAACYNGAPQNVSEWLNRFSNLQAELFVERIPFKETRNYVKKVLATEALYRSLDGDPLDLDLPEGKIGAAPEKFTFFSSTDDGG